MKTRGFVNQIDQSALEGEIYAALKEVQRLFQLRPRFRIGKPVESDPALEQQIRDASERLHALQERASDELAAVMTEDELMTLVRESVDMAEAEGRITETQMGAIPKRLERLISELRRIGEGVLELPCATPDRCDGYECPVCALRATLL